MTILHRWELPRGVMEAVGGMVPASVDLVILGCAFREDDELDMQDGYEVVVAHHTFRTVAIGLTLQNAFAAAYWSWRGWLGSAEYAAIATEAVITGVLDGG